MRGLEPHELSHRRPSSCVALAVVGCLLSVLPLAAQAHAEDETVLSLADGTFELTLEWRSEAGPQAAGAVSWSQLAEHFWFFEPANVEVAVKLIDGGDLNGHYWLFFATLTSIDSVWRGADSRSRPNSG